jgi:hypothetical protein
MYIWKQTLAIERFLEQPRAVFGVMGTLSAAKLRNETGGEVSQ